MHFLSTDQNADQDQKTAPRLDRRERFVKQPPGYRRRDDRLDQNQKIYDALEEYTLAAAGQKKATVTSAQPLTLP